MAHYQGWFVQERYGIMSAVMTYLLIACGQLFLLMVLAPPFPTYRTGMCIIIFIVLAFLAVVSHVKAMITDPGVIPKVRPSENVTQQRRGTLEKKVNLERKLIYDSHRSNNDIDNYCKICESVKPDHATRHCSTCGHCIRNMNRHSFWVNNCIGKNNKKFFILFNLYFMLMAMLVSGMSAWFFIHCMPHEKNFQSCVDAIIPGPFAIVLFLTGGIGCILGLLSLMACFNFVSEIYDIFNNEMGIDNENRSNIQRPWPKRFQEVFGWLNPFKGSS